MLCQIYKIKDIVHNARKRRCTIPGSLSMSYTSFVAFSSKYRNSRKILVSLFVAPLSASSSGSFLKDLALIESGDIFYQRSNRSSGARFFAKPLMTVRQSLNGYQRRQSPSNDCLQSMVWSCLIGETVEEHQTYITVLEFLAVFLTQYDVSGPLYWPKCDGGDFIFYALQNIKTKRKL